MTRGSKPGERRGGRKKGTPNRTTVAIRLRIVEEADPIGRLIQGATAGEIAIGDDKKIALDAGQYIAVLRELRKIIVPEARTALVRISLPAMERPADVAAALGTVVAQMAAGEIAPDEAATIASVLDIRRRAIETVELEERIARLEKETK